MIKSIKYLVILFLVFLMFSCVSTSRKSVEKSVVVPFLWKSDISESLKFQVELPKTQRYVIALKVNNSSDSEKNLNFYTDQGHSTRITVPKIGKTYTAYIEYELMMAGVVNLGLSDIDKGLEVLSMVISDSYILVDKPIDVKPVNPNASTEVVELMSMLGDLSGNRILTGQMDLTWDDSVNMELRVAKFTGQKPAIMGFDFMNYKGTADSGSGLQQTEEALKYAESGGLVSFCWHWRVGPNSKFYTKETDFKISKDVESDEYKSILADIDQVAMELIKLQDRGVPVLWRPLHEASGGWFWWGATGSEDYLYLWDLMYDRMTNYHSLNNLIWVWNGQDQFWYPGDDKVDIIGVDLYKGRGNHDSQKGEYVKAQNYVDGDSLKLIALTENGSIPNPENLLNEHVPWAWFMTWNDNNSNSPNDFFSGDRYTSHKNKRDFFNHPYVMNLDDIK